MKTVSWEEDLKSSSIADLVSSVTGHDDPSEPPPTSYPGGGALLDQYIAAQYQQTMMMMPGMAGNCAPIMWDMRMMAVPMDIQDMHEKSMSWAPAWSPEEAWSTNSTAPAIMEVEDQSADDRWKLEAELRARRQQFEAGELAAKRDEAFGARSAQRFQAKLRGNIRTRVTRRRGDEQPEPGDVRVLKRHVDAAEDLWANANAGIEESFSESSHWPTLNAKLSEDPVPIVEATWPRLAEVVKAPKASASNDAEVSTSSGSRKRDVAIQCDVARDSATEIAVQCDMPTTKIWSSRRGVGICKHCGCASAPTTPAASDMPPRKGLASSESRHGEDDQPIPEGGPDVLAWGPANDWAWDQCSMEEERTPEYSSAMKAEASKVHHSAQLKLQLEQEQLQRFLPPAPSMPAPLPPPQSTSGTCAKGKHRLQFCPATPGSSSTTTPSLTSVDEVSTSSEHGERSAEVPHVEHVDFMSPSDDALADQRKLALLRKQCREAERLEDLAGQGCKLNADQQMKAARLGSAQELRAEVVHLESRLTRAMESIDVSDCEHSDDDDDEDCPAGQSKSSPAANECKSRRSRSTPANQKKPSCATASSKKAASSASVGSEKASAKAPADLSQVQADLSSTTSCVQQTDSVAAAQSRLKRRKCKTKETRPLLATGSKASSLKSSDAGNEELEPDIQRGIHNIFSHTSSIGRLCIVLGVLAIFVVLCTEPGAFLRDTSQRTIDPVEDAIVRLPPAGASNAWTVSRPEDSPSQIAELRVAKAVQAQDVEVARGQAVARQVQAKLKWINKQQRNRQLQRQLQRYKEQDVQEERHRFDRSSQPRSAIDLYWESLQEVERQRMQLGAQAGQWTDEQWDDAQHQLSIAAKQAQQRQMRQQLQKLKSPKPQLPRTIQELRAQAERRLAEASLNLARQQGQEA